MLVEDVEGGADEVVGSAAEEAAAFKRGTALFREMCIPSIPTSRHIRAVRVLQGSFHRNQRVLVEDVEVDPLRPRPSLPTTTHSIDRRIRAFGEVTHHRHPKTCHRNMQ